MWGPTERLEADSDPGPQPWPGSLQTAFPAIMGSVVAIRVVFPTLAGEALLQMGRSVFKYLLSTES